jgi:nucleoside-diphosphate-sugar epimerase
MSKRIFLAGASGVIGRRLVPLLLKAGYQVTGMTRSAQSAEKLEASGAMALVADVFDREAVTAAVAAARPDIVVHQLTDLSLLVGDPKNAATAIVRNARIRAEGTRNLVDAALAAGADRLIAQSIAWAYAPGRTPHGEDDPLDRDASLPRSTTVNGVIALEDAVLRTLGIKGTILRYGQLYGPGAANRRPTGDSPVHVDAAAHAALLAVLGNATGIFNIAEPNGAVATGKAETELGWEHAYRLDPDVNGQQRE